MTTLYAVAGAIIIIALLIVILSVRVLREYERGVIFRLGRLLSGPKGPGLILLIPVIDKMVKADLRTVTLAIPPQEVITKDNVPVRVTAVTYFRVVDPQAAVTQVENYLVATSQIAQTTLRAVLGQHSLDELLSERDKINEILQDIIDGHSSPWGIKISVVEVKDVELPTTMQRAMARQAEAERERRAKIIGAQGEYEAAEQLSMAADRIAASPIALQLRYLQTLLEISLVGQHQHDPADPDRHPAPAAGRRARGLGRFSPRRRPARAAGPDLDLVVVRLGLLVELGRPVELGRRHLLDRGRRERAVGRCQRQLLAPGPSVSTLASTIATAEMRSPSRRRWTITPCVARPICEMPSTAVRCTVPDSVISRISCRGPTTSAPTIAPRASTRRIVSTPIVPRPLRGYSATRVRLP